MESSEEKKIVCGGEVPNHILTEDTNDFDLSDIFVFPTEEEEEEKDPDLETMCERLKVRFPLSTFEVRRSKKNIFGKRVLARQDKDKSRFRRVCLHNVIWPRCKLLPCKSQVLEEAVHFKKTDARLASVVKKKRKMDPKATLRVNKGRIRMLSLKRWVPICDDPGCLIKVRDRNKNYCYKHV